MKVSYQSHSYIEPVTTGRLEAFSDGVIAILITIMVLAFKVPHSASWHALRHLSPLALTYVLSFVNIGIYWNNHHHLIGRTNEVSGPILWTNLVWLFCVSLFPFATGWMGENHFATAPVAFYGCVTLAAALSYLGLQLAIVRHEGRDSFVAQALGRDIKGKLSLGLYIAALALVALNRWISVALYVAVAAIWFVPDRRMDHSHPHID